MNKKPLAISFLLLSIGVIGASPALTQTMKKQTIQVESKPQLAAPPKVTAAPSRADKLQENADNYRIAKCMTDIEEATGYTFRSKDRRCKNTFQHNNKSSITFDFQKVDFSAWSGKGITIKCLPGKKDCVSQGVFDRTSLSIAFKNTPNQNIVQCFELLAKTCTP